MISKNKLQINLIKKQNFMVIKQNLRSEIHQCFITFMKQQKNCMSKLKFTINSVYFENLSFLGTSPLSILQINLQHKFNKITNQIN
ncbi:unnamed protein product [Paramecium pentaurelia]|uniref:Uncharacterized protein n=1 Tax=Paramecium pentaurelia TaxID=43138 RepID=A0A8S1WJB8_9CILI|nr:unnamed protein product [Paramecium pentaurelia]